MGPVLQPKNSHAQLLAAVNGRRRNLNPCGRCPAPAPTTTFLAHRLELCPGKISQLHVIMVGLFCEPRHRDLEQPYRTKHDAAEALSFLDTLSVLSSTYLLNWERHSIIFLG